MSSPPFIDPGANELDLGQIWTEAVPIAGLVALFGGLSLIPFLIGLLVGGGGFALLFTVLAQFVLAVGAGIVLMYVIARAIQIAGE